MMVTKEKKIRVALIAICIVVFVIIVLYIFYLLFNKGISNTSKVDDLKKLNGVYLGEDLTFEMNSLSAEKCNEDNSICLMELEIIAQGNKGIITYKVRNNTDSEKSGKLRVSIGDYMFIFPYNNVQPYNDLAEREKKEVYGYEGYNLDFTVIDEYYVEDAQADDTSLMFEQMTVEDKEGIDVN